MQAMIYIIPASTSALAGRIEISNSQFIQNRNVHFIKVKGEKEIVLWQLSTYIYMYSINVSFNEHNDGSNLISIANGVLYLKGNSTFMNNGYYENIFMLHLSTVIFGGYNVINNNHVKQIMEATSGSYLVMNIRYYLHITNNTVHDTRSQSKHTFLEVPLDHYVPFNSLALQGMKVPIIIMTAMQMKLMSTYTF